MKKWTNDRKGKSYKKKYMKGRISLQTKSNPGVNKTQRQIVLFSNQIK